MIAEPVIIERQPWPEYGKGQGGERMSLSFKRDFEKLVSEHFPGYRLIRIEIEKSMCGMGPRIKYEVHE